MANRVVITFGPIDRGARRHRAVAAGVDAEVGLRAWVYNSVMGCALFIQRPAIEPRNVAAHPVPRPIALAMTLPLATLPLATVPGPPTLISPLHPGSGDGAHEPAVGVTNAVTIAEGAVRTIDAIIRQLAQTIAAVRTALAAPGLDAAESRLDDAAHLLQEIATQSGLLALQLSVTAARVGGSERRVDAHLEPAAPASARSIANIADRLQDLGGISRRTIVAGAVPGCGTTLTALALARVLARDAGVVLVELPQAMPKLASLTLERSAFGIAELVRGAASFDQVISRDRASALHIITAGRVDPDRRTLLVSDRLKLLLDALALSYDQVIIDAGAVSDPAVDGWLRLADRVVLLGVATEEATNAANNRLIAAGFKDIMGLNAAASGPASRHQARPADKRSSQASDSGLVAGRQATNQAVFIGAHPDDIEIGAGGTLVKLLEQNWDVFACIVTDETDPKVAAGRRHEALQSCAALGLRPQQVFFLGMSDGYVTVTREGVDRLRDALKQHNIQPELVFTHSHADCHNDHRAVCELVHAAFRQKVILGFPIINSLNETLFIPQVYGDITNHLERKLRALEIHQSQMKRGRISLIDIEQYNHNMGAVAGCRLSEAFDLTKQYGATTADVEELLARADLMSERRLAENLALRIDDACALEAQAEAATMPSKSPTASS
jgi:LmbE family N-acetylglucosaminyl deacetylase/Mrp family chromosome partitioning ATPase